MITMTIQIEPVEDGSQNEYGAGVRMQTDVDPSKAHQAERATFAGLYMAINHYMRARGAWDFDCLRDSMMRTSPPAAAPASGAQRVAQLEEDKRQLLNCLDKFVAASDRFVADTGLKHGDLITDAADAARKLAHSMRRQPAASQ